MLINCVLNFSDVSCDICEESNFRRFRYKCLVCFDYDLCSKCYDRGLISGRHRTTHPVQCIILLSDFDTFYRGDESVTETQSYTCPCCGQIGFGKRALYDHVTARHLGGHREIMCPLCAASTELDVVQNRLTDNLSIHFATSHDMCEERERALVRRQAAAVSSNRVWRISVPQRNAAAEALGNRGPILPPHIREQIILAHNSRIHSALAVGHNLQRMRSCHGDQISEIQNQLRIIAHRRSQLMDNSWIDVPDPRIQENNPNSEDDDPEIMEESEPRSTAQSIPEPSRPSVQDIRIFDTSSSSDDNSILNETIDETKDPDLIDPEQQKFLMPTMYPQSPNRNKPSDVMRTYVDNMKKRKINYGALIIESATL